MLVAVLCAAVSASSVPTAAIAAIDDEPNGLVTASAPLSRVRALYERAHSREHSRGLTIEEDWRLFQDGIVGSYRVKRFGKDIRETTTLGPLTYGRGVFHGTHWEQNRNGIVFTYPGVRDQRDAVSDRAFRDPIDERNVHVVGDSAAFNAYVVEVNPSGGRHEWLFIDKRTGNLARREFVERRRRYATNFDDYRVVDGVPEPSRARTTDSLGNEREQILVNRVLDLSPDVRDVEIPTTRHILEFSDRQSTVRLPVRFVNGLAVVRVIVARSAYDFLLDSGAAGIIVDPSVVEQQSLETYGRKIGATFGTFPETTTIVPQLSVGALRMRNIVARVVRVPFKIDGHTKLVGLLGFDFFADAIVHLNLERSVAEVIQPDHFRAPADTSTIGVALDDKTPAVAARAGNANGRVVLDTGANRTVFETAFAERGDFLPERVAATMHVRGIGGFAAVESTRVPSFEIGGIWLRGAMADVANADLGSDDIDGIMGTDLLRSYELWFDYRAGTIHARRAKRAREAFSRGSSVARHAAGG